MELDSQPSIPTRGYDRLTANFTALEAGKTGATRETRLASFNLEYRIGQSHTFRSKFRRRCHFHHGDPSALVLERTNNFISIHN